MSPTPQVLCAPTKNKTETEANKPLNVSLESLKLNAKCFSAGHTAAPAIVSSVPIYRAKQISLGFALLGRIEYSLCTWFSRPDRVSSFPAGAGAA